MPPSRYGSQGLPLPPLKCATPGEYVQSRWLSGAPEGWVNLPTAGEDLSPGTEKGAGLSAGLVKGVRRSAPTGLNDMPFNNVRFRGSLRYPGPKAGRPEARRGTLEN